jgi:hypothetical protein
MTSHSNLITDIDPEILEDPFLFKELCWPDISFYDDQALIIKSVQENIETYVPAGNMLGKDFISAFIALHFFCSRVPARVVTSSVDHSQLKGVLWGELRRFIDSSQYPLGIQVNDLMIRQLRPDGTLEPRSELIGRVAQKGEGMLGRHIERGPNHAPRTLAIIDEASGFEDVHYKSIATWAHRILIIGNPYPCENFFKKGVTAGDLRDTTTKKSVFYFRKVIKIKAERSPNVRLALAEIAQGLEPSLTEIVPGVMSYQEYCQRRATWDEMAQSIGLDAEFYEGKEVKLFPPLTLRACHEYAMSLGHSVTSLQGSRKGTSMGVDTGEGGDATVWTVVDEGGILEQVSIRTPDTSVIPGRTIAMIHDYGITPSRVLFDAGGGGKEHVDLLRNQGYPVKAIAFGGSPTSPDEFALWKRMPDEKKDEKETRQEYKNRRAEMYGETAKLLRGVHPSGIGRDGFSLPDGFEELLFQLSKIPKLWDGEGRLYLPPKSKPNPNYQGVTLKDMIGHSPDEADSFVLAVFGLVWTEFEPVVKPMF